jgi:hypothetical protein
LCAQKRLNTAEKNGYSIDEEQMIQLLMRVQFLAGVGILLLTTYTLAPAQ